MDLKQSNKKRKRSDNKLSKNGSTSSLSSVSNSSKLKSSRTNLKKQKKKDDKILSPPSVMSGNSFKPLANIDDSDYISIASSTDEDSNSNTKQDVMVLLDSDSEIESPQIIETAQKRQNISTVENESKETNHTITESKVPEENGLTNNEDFIGFDFSSDEDEKIESNSENGHFSKDKNFEYDNFDEDDAYLSNDDGSLHIAKSKNTVNSDFPWIKNNDHSKQIEIADWLTLEIKDFIKYISPSKEEIEARNEAVRKLRYAICTRLWEDCEVHVFGSFATDLYLPGSDIDMVITSPSEKYDTRSHLYQLSAFLRNNDLAIQVETVAKAKVPIIKFVEPESRIHIDISFERTNGLTAAKNIRTWLKETPGLRELVLIVKQFLAVRRLNNVHVGGLGGYSIICLVYSFLKLHPRIATKSIDPLENLGVLLIEFFELYGYNFGYDNVAICFRNGEPRYLQKRSNPDMLARNTFSLAIEDPDDMTNNISRGSFNIRDIKRSFGGAFELLVNRCYELNQASYKSRLNQSILGGVIKYKGKERSFEDERNQVINEALVVNEEDEETKEIRTLHLKKTGTLPPLPSEHRNTKIVMGKTNSKKLKSENDIHYYSDYSSDSESEKKNEETAQFAKIIDESQSYKKPKVDDLMGIQTEDNESDDDDNDNDKNGITKKTNADDQPSDTSDGETARASKIDKNARRDYWAQKGGM